MTPSDRPLGPPAGQAAGAGGNLRGAGLMLVNAAVYSVMAMIIRALAPQVPMSVIMFVSVATQFAFIGGRALRRIPAVLAARPRRRLHLLRVGALLTSMVAGFHAVAMLPLAISTSLSFSKAMFVTILAWLWLRETVGLWRWLGVVTGFCGVLLLMEPTGDAVRVGAAGLVLGLVSAAAAALGAILTRRLAADDPSEVLLIWQTALGTLVLLPPALVDGRLPSAGALGALAVMGLLSVLGNLSLIAALRRGEASALAPVDFTRAIFSGLLGWIAFQELPGPLALAGMGVIVLGTLMSMRRQGPPAPPPPAPPPPPRPARR